MTEHVLIVGQGYVGLPLAMRAVDVGFDVTGLDVDARKVKLLMAGESYVEDVADGELAAALATGRFRATTTLDDVADFDVVVISVPTLRSCPVRTTTARCRLGRYLTLLRHRGGADRRRCGLVHTGSVWPHRRSR